MDPNSKNSAAVRLAFLKGYRVINGEVHSPHGRIRKCDAQYSCRGRPPYLRFNIGMGGNVRMPVRVHQLLAYQKYGEKLFDPAIVVRHKDGNPLNNRWLNILLGTQRQNQMDRPKQERQLHAAKGNRQHSPQLIQELKKDHANGLSYNMLALKHGLPKSTLSYYLSPKAKRRSFTGA